MRSGAPRSRCRTRPGDPEQIAARAGHTSVSVGLDRYGHPFPDRDADLTAWLDALVAAGQGDAALGLVLRLEDRRRG
jgi:hypothetical protein